MICSRLNWNKRTRKKSFISSKRWSNTYIKKNYLFWLCWILVVARRISVVAWERLVAACMWDLVPRPGIEPRPPALGAQSLTHWITREVPINTFFKKNNIMKQNQTCSIIGRVKKLEKHTYWNKKLNGHSRLYTIRKNYYNRRHYRKITPKCNRKRFLKIRMRKLVTQIERLYLVELPKEGNREITKKQYLKRFNFQNWRITP